jgi:MFS transporter, ACS family, glucarate transporter
MKTGRNWPMVLMLCFTATAGYICRVNVTIAGPLIMKEFGITQIGMGRIFSAFILGYALFQVPSGMIADKFGARTVLTVTAWLWVLFTSLQVTTGLGLIFTGINAALICLMVWRGLLGISASPTYPASAKGVSGWIHPSFQASANGIVISSIGIGSALAPLIVSGIMVHWGWRTALLVSGIPALLAAIAWLIIKKPAAAEIHPKENQPDKISFRPFRSKNFILLTISYTLQGYVGYIFVSWFYLYLVQERHFGLVSGALMSSLPWILSIFSIPFGGFMSDLLTSGRLGQKWGRRIIPIIGMAGSGLFISLGAHTLGAVTAAVCLALATALILCVEGPFWTMMLNISGPAKGKAGGIMNMGSNIGGLISPALTPVVASIVGWEMALHLAAVLAVIAAILWLWIRND